MVYIFIEPYLLRTKNIEFESTEVPENFNNIKIVFIADIHHGPYFSHKRVVKLVDRINKLEPDIILLGGDYVHRYIKYIEPIINEFGKFETKLENNNYKIYVTSGVGTVTPPVRFFCRPEIVLLKIISTK